MRLIDISIIPNFEVKCSDGEHYILLPFEHLSDIPVVENPINEYSAFKTLCRTLHMDAVLDEDTDYYIITNDFGDSNVCYMKNGHQEILDDRGDLFVALRNVAVQLFPNVLFRSDDYIYNKGD